MPPSRSSRSRGFGSRLWRFAGRVARGVASAAEWVFGLISLVLGLSMLAALPVIQVLSLGYFLESSARVARTGRLRDGLIGVRPAARIGCLAAAIWLSLVPAWLVGSYARSAELIDPGGPAARNWRIALVVVTVVSLLYVAASCARGGRLRHFLWPWGHPFWLVRRFREGGLYSEARDGLWAFVASLRVPYYFRLGLVGFVGTLAWLVVPAILIGATQRFPAAGAARGNPPGGDRAVPAFLTGPLRGRGACFGTVFQEGHPRPIPPGSLGFCFLSLRAARGGDPALLPQDRNDPT